MKNYPNCIDCGKRTHDYESKRCWDCYAKQHNISKNISNPKKHQKKYGTMLDRSNSLEYRKNLSESLKGHIPWNKGKKGVQISTRKGIHTKPKHYCLDCKKELPLYSESLRCISCANKEKMKFIDLSGEKNPNYIDGRTFIWKKTRKQVFERDNYTCQICKKRGNVYLNAHHIINRHICEDIFDINNLITLCRECHLYITNIEMTERYSEYKDKFINYIEKINKGENHVGSFSIFRE